MIRRFGERIRADINYKTRPGAYAVLFDGRQVLLTFQDAPVPEFQLPGGGIDAGESPICALHREVLEETGWTVSNPVRLGCYRRFAYMPEYDLWAEKTATIYLARPALRRGMPSEPGHTAVWMDAKHAFVELASEGDRQYLALALGL